LTISVKVALAQTDSHSHISELLAQINQLNVEKNSLEETKNNQAQEIKHLQEALIQKTKESKKLHQIIIETGQNDREPADDVVVSDFNSLSNSIMRIVKKHYTYQGKASSIKLKWKEYNTYNPENRELFLRALIADRLFKHLFSTELGRGLFGLDRETESSMGELE